MKAKALSVRDILINLNVDPVTGRVSQPFTAQGYVDPGNINLTAQVLNLQTDDSIPGNPNPLFVPSGTGQQPWVFSFPTLDPAVSYLLLVSTCDGTGTVGPSDTSASQAFQVAAVPPPPPPELPIVIGTIIQAPSSTAGLTDISVPVTAPADTDVTVTGVLDLSPLAPVGHLNRPKVVGRPKGVHINAGQQATIRFNKVPPSTLGGHLLTVYPHAKRRPRRTTVRVP